MPVVKESIKTACKQHTSSRVSYGLPATASSSSPGLRRRAGFGQNERGEQCYFSCCANQHQKQRWRETLRLEAHNWTALLIPNTRTANAAHGYLTAGSQRVRWRWRGCLTRIGCAPRPPLHPSPLPPLRQVPPSPGRRGRNLLASKEAVQQTGVDRLGAASAGWPELRIACKTRACIHAACPAEACGTQPRRTRAAGKMVWADAVPPHRLRGAKQQGQG